MPGLKLQPSGSTLVIGYGNELRNDDALGPRLARIIARQRYPGVQVLIRHQLIPELADPISAAETVVFLDATVSRAPLASLARLQCSRGAAEVTRLTPFEAETASRGNRVSLVTSAATNPGAAVLDGTSLFPDEQVRLVRIAPHSPNLRPHHSDPAALLQLARLLSGRSPDSWWLTIPGFDFGFGHRLSEGGRRNLRKALAMLRQFLRVAVFSS